MKKGLRNKIHLYSLMFVLLVGSSELLGAECVEEKNALISEFIGTDFDKGRSTVGEDQVIPIKNKVERLLLEHPEYQVSEIIVTASSAKVPFYIVVKNKKVIDQDSDKKNFSLAEQRAVFAQKVFSKLKKQSSLSGVKMVFHAKLAGPDFKPLDLNDRFVSPMTPGYENRIRALYKENKKLYEEEALTHSPDKLLDEKIFMNLYQAKFKPFQGFKLQVMGFDKNKSKCRAKIFLEGDSSEASKQ